jgi:hypothetical protein
VRVKLDENLGRRTVEVFTTAGHDAATGVRHPSGVRETFARYRAVPGLAGRIPHVDGREDQATNARIHIRIRH